MTEEVFEWERLNDSKAIWLRSPGEVSDEEYNDFYKAMTKEFADPLGHTHFSAEGDVEFRSILFVPSSPPANMFGEYYQQVRTRITGLL